MAKKCMESGQRWCPDYEIIQWNCDNYDVTDYARSDVLDKQGGIYLDLDLELVHKFRLSFAKCFFAGFGPLRDVELAVFGCVTNHSLVKEMSLYPRDIFSPRNWFTGKIAATENTFGIHHCAGGWISKKVKDGNEEWGKVISPAAAAKLKDSYYPV